MANGMMNNPDAPMGGQPPMGEPPMGNPMGGQQEQMGGVDDAVLDMHLTEDVKKALSAKGVDISAVADRGPQEPVVVIPISVIMNRYQGGTPEESMKQFVQDMTANAQTPATEPMPQQAMAETPPPSPEGLGAPPMDRPPMTA
tara:strand:- start:42 stop:470 length:429 start_codon:yes stop_codon:yes gene_type:complete